jgi:MFS family permease
MLDQIRTARQKYPSQFWLLFWGMLISTIGASMIWPFLMVYVSERLQLKLTVVASLMTINALSGLVFSFVAGPVVDRTGRKWVMVISLAANGLVYFFMSRAGTLVEFAVLQALSGAANPLYRVGADAMMADLIPEGERVEAYSLLRMSNNIGVAIGPAAGGFIASSSYSLAFYFAMAGLIAYSLLMAFLGKETLPVFADIDPERRKILSGYKVVLKHGEFMGFTFSFLLTQIASAILWVLLAVYIKQNYGVPEKAYGLLPTTNAIMVVALQLWVTSKTRRYRPPFMLAVGSVIYATAVGSIAFGQGFWAFWLSMVVMTFGELILTPTATTYAANLAPPDMRGRYMSIYGLTWSLAVGIGPVFGGFLSDNFGARFPWYGGWLVGLLGAVGFIILTRQTKSQGALVE